MPGHTHCGFAQHSTSYSFVMHFQCAPNYRIPFWAGRKIGWFNAIQIKQNQQHDDKGKEKEPHFAIIK